LSLVARRTHRDTVSSTGDYKGKAGKYKELADIDRSRSSGCSSSPTTPSLKGMDTESLLSGSVREIGKDLAELLKLL
jgi:hypothetical protein